MKRFLLSALAVPLLLAGGLACAEERVMASVHTDKQGNDTIVDITFTPLDGAKVRDLHLRLPNVGVKFAFGTNVHGPFAGTSVPVDENGHALDDAALDGWSWKPHTTKGRHTITFRTKHSGIKPVTGPVTVRLRASKPHGLWVLDWIATRTGYENPDTPGGVISSGQFDDPVAPVRLAALTGPRKVVPGTLATLTVDAAVDASVVMPYTVRATLSLDPNDPTLVNAADPVPPEWGLRMTTNSPEGTTSPSTSVVQATYHGDMRNVLVLDFPDDPAWIGRTIYLQAEFGDGTSTLVHTIEVVASLPQDDP